MIFVGRIGDDSKRLRNAIEHVERTFGTNESETDETDGRDRYAETGYERQGKVLLSVENVGDPLHARGDLTLRTFPRSTPNHTLLGAEEESLQMTITLTILPLSLFCDHCLYGLILT